MKTLCVRSLTGTAGRWKCHLKGYWEVEYCILYVIIILHIMNYVLMLLRNFVLDLKCISFYRHLNCTGFKFHTFSVLKTIPNSMYV